MIFFCGKVDVHGVSKERKALSIIKIEAVCGFYKIGIMLVCENCTIFFCKICVESRSTGSLRT